MCFSKKKHVESGLQEYATRNQITFRFLIVFKKVSWIEFCSLVLQKIEYEIN
jgi:hypothetical protein